jgi:hypothetical protein
MRLMPYYAETGRSGPLIMWLSGELQSLRLKNPHEKDKFQALITATWKEWNFEESGPCNDAPTAAAGLHFLPVTHLHFFTL